VVVLTIFAERKNNRNNVLYKPPVYDEEPILSCLLDNEEEVCYNNNLTKYSSKLYMFYSVAFVFKELTGPI
jgi:hypothetical protein